MVRAPGPDRQDPAGHGFDRAWRPIAEACPAFTPYSLGDPLSRLKAWRTQLMRQAGLLRITEAVLAGRRMAAILALEDDEWPVPRRPRATKASVPCSPGR